MSHSTIHLSANLSHLAWALEHNHTPERVLVPDLKGEYFYSHGLYKCILKIIYFATDRIFHKNLCATRYRSALQKTYDLYVSELNTIEGHFQFYDEYIKRQYQEEDISEPQQRKFSQVCSEIIMWGNWIMPYFKNESTRCHINQYFKDRFNLQEAEETQNHCFDQFKMMKRIMTFEKSRGEAFPIKMLGLISRFNPEDENGFAKIQEGIRKINSWGRKNARNGSSPVELFHKALQAYLFLSQQHREGASREEAWDDVVHITYDIEARLQKLGCTLFSQQDFKQTKFIQAVRNSRVEKRKVGQELGLNVPGLHAFKSPENNAAIVVLGDNRSLLGLLEMQKILEQCPVPEPLRISSIDLKGRYALFPAWHKTLSQYQWEEGFEEKKEDNQVVQLVINMLKTLKKNRYTPTNLTPDVLVLDEKCTLLKTLVPMSNHEPYDQNLMKTFVYKAFPSEVIRKRVYKAVGLAT